MPLDDQGAPNCGTAAMQPVYFSNALGWLHWPSGPAASFGVVLCPALAREGRWVHRTVGELADRLAGAGFPVLRLDYPGTGDCAELDAKADQLAVWRAAIQAAADMLKARSGVSRVAFWGVRFGALIAADAACQRNDVAALALMAPVLSGRAYARELRLAALTGGGDSPSDSIELDGLLLDTCTLNGIASLNLARMPAAPAARVLLVDDGNACDDYAAALRTMDVIVTRRAFPGVQALMQITSSNKVPHADLAVVTNWFSEVARHDSLHDVTPQADESAESDAILCSAGFRERIVRFGPGQELVGVLCEPDAESPSDRALLITNTGGDSRAGIGRFGARLARHLAPLGVASLRFDFAGIGDSRLGAGNDNHLYETNRREDIKAALDVLEAHGYRRVAATGICTGAYHLLQALGDEPRIRHLFAINLVAFVWRTGETVEASQQKLAHSTAYYLDLVRRPETWMRLGCGRIDMRHVATTLVSRLLQRAVRIVRRVAPRLVVTPTVNEARRVVDAALSHGARVTFLFGFDDPGIATLERYFGGAGRDLRQIQGVSVQIERGIDHTLSRIAMQEQVIALLAGRLAIELPDHAHDRVDLAAEARHLAAE